MPPASTTSAEPSPSSSEQTSEPAPAPSSAGKLSADADAGLPPDDLSDPAMVLLTREQLQVLAAAGLEQLAETPPAGEFEVRVWYRLAERRLFLRLWSVDAQLHGAAYLWWHATQNEVDYQHLELDGWVDCPTPKTQVVPETQEAMSMCRVHPPEGHDWGPALAKLERHQLWTLPDAQQLEGALLDEEVFEVLLVELRDGQQLRRYHYRDIELDPRPQAQVALELVQATKDAFFELEWDYDESGEPIKTRRPAPRP